VRQRETKSDEESESGFLYEVVSFYLLVGQISS